MRGTTQAPQPGSAGKVVELFAGVGGFRLGLERAQAGWQTVWANQWEPSTRIQHAANCYGKWWDDGTLVNEDIATVLDDVPEHDLLVGGFPCQDYSVAKTLSQANGLEGRKGVLWWSIHEILRKRQPKTVFLENVDRLLKSPATQRGRDFAIILACLSDLGYLVEWRVVNAAHYGFPQRRRRVFIVAHHVDAREPVWRGPMPWIYEDGALARSLPVEPGDVDLRLDGTDQPRILEGSLVRLTRRFGVGNRVTPFATAGVMWGRKLWTRRVEPKIEEPRVLHEVLQSVDEVPETFYIPDSQLDQWRYLKGAKREERTAGNGHVYHYSEGAIAFPDALDQPSRTILTGEGGSSPSRFKHLIQTPDGRFRRLTPVELERLNGFPDDWTNTGMPDTRRAFMMGNALVVGLVERVGGALADTPQAQRADRLVAAVGS